MVGSRLVLVVTDSAQVIRVCFFTCLIFMNPRVSSSNVYFGHLLHFVPET